MVKSIQGRHSGLLVCSFLKDRLVRSRASEDGIRGAPLTYSLLADPIAEPGEGPWAGGRQLPHLFPESALELSLPSGATEDPARRMDRMGCG